MVTLVSASGNRARTASAISKVEPILLPSATTMMLEVFLFSAPRSRAVKTSSRVVFCSGKITAKAPVARPVCRAMNPASRPMTSTKNRRLWELAVSRILSMHSMTVLQAVSYPMVRSVPKRSLSMVPGMPTTGMPCSSHRRWPPVKVPFPPITTSPSMPCWRICAAASARPSGVRKRSDRADISTVPPISKMFLTLLVLSSVVSPAINPSYPR